jgi:hypothetical protein
MAKEALIRKKTVFTRKLTGEVLYLELSIGHFGK